MTISQRVVNGPTPKERANANAVDVPADRALRTIPRKHQCSNCGQQWSSPRVHKGTRHRGCTASPKGRFGVQPLSEKKLEKP